MCFIIGNRLSLELLPITSCLWFNNIALNPSNLTNMLWICCFQWQTCCEFAVSNLASSYFQLVMILFEAPLLSWCYQRHNKDPAKCLWWNFFLWKQGSSIKYVRKIFRKTNISNFLIRTRTCAYQGVRNVSFSENFTYALNGWPLPDFHSFTIFAEKLHRRFLTGSEMSVWFPPFWLYDLLCQNLSKNEKNP